MAETETGYVYNRSGVPLAERDALLQELGQELTAVIHYSQSRIQFAAWRPATLAANGQAFGPKLEVRWQPEGNGRWQMLFLSETEQPALEQKGWELTEMVVDSSTIEIWLWGSDWRKLVGADTAVDLPSGWVQAEIPADLQYPVTGSKQKPEVFLQGCRYSQAGINRFTRFTGIQAGTADGNKEQGNG